MNTFTTKTGVYGNGDSPTYLSQPLASHDRDSDLDCSAGAGGHGGQAQAPAQDPNTFTVNRVEDAVDALPGNGLCDADANDKVLQYCSFVAPNQLLVGNRNLSSDSSCAFVEPGLNLLNSDPQLEPLSFNHGQTPNHELLPGSPAIDGGNNSNCTSVDQRGGARPQGLRCDISAFEVQ